MRDFPLQPNESVIMKHDRVMYGDKIMPNFTDELILTNLNLILVCKGIFGNSKDVKIFPIAQIKVFNDQASVLISKIKGRFSRLEVYFVNGQACFDFESKKEAQKWVAAINQLVSGQASAINLNPSKAIPGTEVIVNAISGTADVFKRSFGRKSKSSIGSKAAMKCTSCGAPISGTEGQVVKCQYSDHYGNVEQKDICSRKDISMTFQFGD